MVDDHLQSPARIKGSASEFVTLHHSFDLLVSAAGVPPCNSKIGFLITLQNILQYVTDYLALFVIQTMTPVGDTTTV